jgi:hypothetical protein
LARPKNRSHNADAPRLDAVISDQASLVTTTRAAAASAARSLSRKTSPLRGLETGFQSNRLVYQRDERRARSERAAVGQHPERKPIENNRTLLIVEARFG